MSRHLVLVVQNFPVPEDRRVWLEACAARDAGWQVTAVCPALRGHHAGVATVDDVTIHYLPAYEGQGPAGVVVEGVLGAWRTTRAVRRLGLGEGDVLQVCTPPDSLPHLLGWARRRGVVTVYDQHDVVPLLAETKRSQRPLAPVHRWLERATVANASLVITAGEEQAARLRARYGVEPVVVRTAAGDTDRRHVPREAPTTIGYVGVMGTQDGVGGLVQALRVLRDRGRVDTRLRLAGDGPDLANLRASVHTLGLDEHVEFCGWLDEDELEGFVSGVDCLVVPDPVTEFNHTCPMLKVSHALALGLPTVLTPLRENMAIVGSAGVVAADDRPASIADAVERLFALPADDRRAVGNALRQRYDDVLAWDTHRARYLDALAATTAA